MAGLFFNDFTLPDVPIGRGFYGIETAILVLDDGPRVLATPDPDDQHIDPERVWFVRSDAQCFEVLRMWSMYGYPFASNIRQDA